MSTFVKLLFHYIITAKKRTYSGQRELWRRGSYAQISELRWHAHAHTSLAPWTVAKHTTRGEDRRRGTAGADSDSTRHGNTTRQIIPPEAETKEVLEKRLNGRSLQDTPNSCTDPLTFISWISPDEQARGSRGAPSAHSSTRETDPSSTPKPLQSDRPLNTK